MLNAKKPLVMGVLNVTPDSFSDGGQFMVDGEFVVEKAVDAALQMVLEGADVIDVGGESTGPGSVEVSLEEELARVLPVIRGLRARSGGLISVDTYKAVVAREALGAGANWVNDVTALRGDAEMVDVIAKSGAPVVLMYSKNTSARTTDEIFAYENVMDTLCTFFAERLAFAQAQGVRREQIILDPGMGAFVSGDPKYSLEILRRLEELQRFGLPVLVGPSRKSFIGKTLNLGVTERLEGGLACCALAVSHGAAILRTHDILATRRTVDMAFAIKTS